jgi:CRISPR-associated protein Cas5 subtype I-C
MSYGIRLRVSGEFACFTRPEMKVERVSYDLMTPSAARGILEAIHWRPAIRWVVEAIHVLKPIRFQSIRRNEVGHKVPVASIRKAMNSGDIGDLALLVDDDRQQRAATVLADVAYVIEAKFELTAKAGPGDNEGKHLESCAHPQLCYGGQREDNVLILHLFRPSEVDKIFRRPGLDEMKNCDARAVDVVIGAQPHEKSVPMSLDVENRDTGYLLGRLFAAYEYAQTQALGGRVRATIRDQYYGTASATPRAVFPLLQRKAMHDLSRLRKDSTGLVVDHLDQRIGEIFELADPESFFVPALSAQRQALFAIGYYHQRNDFNRSKDDARGAVATTRPEQ